jgi:hypothetical protein
METWLSYIQPWRYSHGSRDENQEDQTMGVSRTWLPFIAGNLFFYNTMLFQVMERLSRFDLLSPKVSFMVFRLTKIFSSSGLIDRIREAEDNVERLGERSLISGKSRIPSSSKLLMDSLIKQSSSEEWNGEEKVTSSSRKATECIRSLTQQLLTARRLIQLDIKSFQESCAVSSKSSGIKGFLESLFIGSEESTSMDITVKINDMKKTEANLTTSLDRLKIVFESAALDAVDVGNEVETQVRQRHFSSPSSGRRMPPEVTSSPEGTDVLTAEGRRQLKYRLAKATVGNEGNPDIQATRSFEIHFLVVFIIWLCKHINKYVSPFLDQNYSGDGILSAILQQLVSPPVSFITIVKDSDIRQPPIRKLETLPARVNLRFLANKYILGSFFFFYFFLRLMGSGLPFLIIYVGLPYFLIRLLVTLTKRFTN